MDMIEHPEAPRGVLGSSVVVGLALSSTPTHIPGPLGHASIAPTETSDGNTVGFPVDLTPRGLRILNASRDEAVNVGATDFIGTATSSSRSFATARASRRRSWRALAAPRWSKTR